MSQKSDQIIIKHTLEHLLDSRKPDHKGLARELKNTWREEMTPAQIRYRIKRLRETYPWFDTLIIALKSGIPPDPCTPEWIMLQLFINGDKDGTARSLGMSQSDLKKQMKQIERQYPNFKSDYQLLAEEMKFREAKAKQRRSYVSEPGNSQKRQKKKSVKKPNVF